MREQMNCQARYSILQRLPHLQCTASTLAISAKVEEISKEENAAQEEMIRQEMCSNDSVATKVLYKTNFFNFTFLNVR